MADDQKLYLAEMEKEEQTSLQVDREQARARPSVEVKPTRKRNLNRFSVEKLISLFQSREAAGAWNEDMRAEILRLIMEKGGMGAVRRALGREMLGAVDGAQRPAQGTGESAPVQARDVKDLLPLSPCAAMMDIALGAAVTDMWIEFLLEAAWWFNRPGQDDEEMQPAPPPLTVLHGYEGRTRLLGDLMTRGPRLISLEPLHLERREAGERK